MSGAMHEAAVLRRWRETHSLQMLQLLKAYVADDPCAPGDPRYIAAKLLTEKIEKGKTNESD